MQELSELTTLGYFNKMQTHRLGTSLARLTRMDSGTGPKRVVGSGLDKIRAECRSAFPIFFCTEKKSAFSVNMYHSLGLCFAFRFQKCKEEGS